MDAACRRFTIHPMRRFVLLILVAVLCLRVWAGEAMAGHMLAQQVAAAAASAPAEPAPAMVEHAPDCPGASADTAPAAGHADCSSCLSCQDCSLNAMTMAFGAQLFAQPAPLTPARHFYFASADPRPGFKPPIA